MVYLTSVECHVYTSVIYIPELCIFMSRNLPPVEIQQQSEMVQEKEEERKRKRKEVVGTHWCVLCKEDGSMEVSISSSILVYSVISIVMYARLSAVVQCAGVQADVLSQKFLFCSHYTKGQWDLTTTTSVRT